MKLYTGINLHSSNSYVGIIDETGKRAFNRKLANDSGIILDTLAPFMVDAACHDKQATTCMGNLTRPRARLGKFLPSVVFHKAFNYVDKSF